MSDVCVVLLPITIFGGLKKSCMDVPSRRNSGFAHTSKPVPDFLPEYFSISGIIVFSVVPGRTVLRITIIWCDVFFCRDLPIWVEMFSMYFRSSEPSSLLGVPTQMKLMSVSWMALSVSAVAFSFFDSTASFMYSSSFGSISGDFPWFMVSTLFLFMSMPVIL